MAVRENYAKFCAVPQLIETGGGRHLGRKMARLGGDHFLGKIFRQIEKKT